MTIEYAACVLATVRSYLLQGIDALPCEVELNLDELAFTSGSSPRDTIVGLPDTGVKEAMERVRAALVNSGYSWPNGRVVINLAPADLRKEGPLYDLPIAVASLIVQGVIRGGSGKTVFPARSLGLDAASEAARGSASADHFDDDLSRSGEVRVEPPDHRRYVFAGELALDGRVRPVRGIIALASMAARDGAAGVVVPIDNAAEAAVVPGIEVFGVRTLTEVVGLLTGSLDLAPQSPPDIRSLLESSPAPIDFAEVRGQEAVKRALVIAAAGSHNIVMLGPAGSGKTMMAKALPGVLPPLTPEEAVEITRIYSAAGQLAPGQGLVTQRPVRSPHHTASAAAIVGGGMVPRPGEISLAHRGVLFMDELPEFPRDVLETLRQPLEDHVVTIARSHSAVRFPANFMLVAAMNPTPKGDVAPGEVGKRAMERYLSRLSGPLLDRIDLHVEAPAVPWKELSRGVHGSGDPGPRGTSSGEMRDRAGRARRIQSARQGAGTPNSRLSGKQLDELAPMDDAARAILGRAMTELGLSARAYDKIRRVARTIADLADEPVVSVGAVGEAIGYRLLDRRV